MLKAAAAKAYKSGLALIVGAAFVLSPSLADARRSVPESAEMPAVDTVALSELPREGRSTYALILRGGPFAHDKDGTVFGNRERILPRQTRGYYREYTVRTPGSRDRGARRIVCGGEPQRPDACYYTSDHYSSFRKIIE
ncbi:Guanyl-specific ribonuclease Sa [Delftia tsuruhatensis]|uniref:ribonuclease n=1 Tax=Delftia tsuruhatensis TaxID=180282 RepID=UPI001E6F1593|nr:ribonuclease [Delftia tsuruhatensis]CAB5706032.1 Guanyl-specific ribonuclease Sa [Delftia tsuruhatensis]CAC9693856.1 Guanyl-specific ribonuclease Sa [Delftia tsuruhatensis]